MTDHKYTDEEVIMALECHKDWNGMCGSCPYELGKACGVKLATNALDLINRQREEIERLTVELDAMRGAANSYKMNYENAKAEAVKELAASLLR